MAKNEQMTERELIEALQATVQEQAEFIKQIMEQASPYATVAYVHTEADKDGNMKIVVANGGALIETLAPSFPVKAGDPVAIVGQSGQIARAGLVNLRGDITEVKKVVSPTLVEIDKLGGGVTIVFKDPALELKEGDRVQLDQGSAVIIEKLESAALKYMKPATKVTWEDIGGLEEVKKTLKEIVELPHTMPAIFAYYNYTPPKGVLLSGPPGCGKTMLGKATATAVASVGDGVPGFIYVKGPELLNKFVGESESRIRGLFDQAREHKKEHGSPAIVFIDEAESLLSRRGTGISSDMEKTIVPAFLAEMDGLEDTAAVVILATNRPDQLDPAVVRDGRIDRKISVTRPTREAALEIARLNFAKTPTRIKGGTESLAEKLVETLWDPAREIINVHTSTEGDVLMHMYDLISGSMIANAASRATSFALQRDLASGNKSGVNFDDVLRGVDLIANEMRGVSQDDEIREFAETKGVTVKGFSKLKEPIKLAA